VDTRRSPRRVALRTPAEDERAPRGTPVSQADGAQGIEATPASGAVAARWPPLLATETSASPPCPLATSSSAGGPQLAGRLPAFRVYTRVRPTSSQAREDRLGSPDGGQGSRLDAQTQPRRLTADDVMLAREVAGLLHAPVSTVEDWARRGILPSVKIGRRRLYIREQIETVLTKRS
jgi:excisionase family DNA binding protein